MQHQLDAERSPKAASWGSQRVAVWLWWLLVCLAACSGPPVPTPSHQAPPQPFASAATSVRVAPAPPPSPSAEPLASPQFAELGERHRQRIDSVVEAGIARGNYPGAVVLVQRDGHDVFLRAYGARALAPARATMTTDTVFDIASLTKPVATATAIMILRDRGLIALDSPVDQYLSGCALPATIEQLLTHRSGLPAANALRHYQTHASAIAAICAEKVASRAAAKEIYSDLGYILLAEVVARVSGVPFATFTQEAIFGPLRMNDTGFVPDTARQQRCAPTEERNGAWLQGTVHDPRAAALAGVAGHAGLFSTAADLGRWAKMLLGEGVLDGSRLLSRDAVRAMLAPRGGSLRTLALVRSAVGGLGHTGFTGTSVWIDPTKRAALVILTSRLHVAGGGDVTELRQQVRAAVLDGLREQNVAAGVDVLVGHGFRELAGKTVGLITNATGRTRSGALTHELLQAAPDVKLVAIFSPEHGFAARAEGAVQSTQDGATGVPIFSLYGESQRPSAVQLRGIDTLVFDVQSIGARFYTYLTTLGYALETAAAHDIEVVVLDRPNPIGGTRIEGPLLEKARRSFVGYHTLPVRHGMTVGELAVMFNTERKLGAKLTVVPVSGWRREQLFAETGLPWTDPSPNIRSPEAALLYPGLALLEMTNVSVGRGTDAPFTRIGAPWIDPALLLGELAEAQLPGVQVAAETFTPEASVYAQELCRGVHFTVTNGSELLSVKLGLVLAVALQKHHRNTWQTSQLITLMGHQATVQAIVRGDGVEAIADLWVSDLEAFRRRRQPFLLY